MSGDWTYEPPESKPFVEAFSYYLKTNGQEELASIIRKSDVVFSVTSTYGFRSFSFRTIVYCRLPIPQIERANQIIRDNILERDLLNYANLCVPVEAGLDITAFEITPLLTTSTETTVIDDIENIVDDLPQNIQQIIVPLDFRDKMKEMTPFYSSLYIIENVLRLFTTNVLVDKFGNDDLHNISLNSKQIDRIKERKTKERKKKWMRSRGDSELYYLDFSDFSFIIENNWTVFKPYFPSVKWITQKLDELSDCRNIIAHTSYLGDNEKEAIKLYFKQIIDQIKDTI